MLDVFRKHATSWVIKVFFALIVIVFVFWGGYSYREDGQTEIARIDDHAISVAEYDRTYNQMLEVYRRQLGGSLSEEMLKQFNLKRQALDALIDQFILSRAARELGLEATEQEVQQRILEFAAFQADGKFDQQRYNILLQQNRLTPETFERQVGEEIGREKLEGFVKRRAVVTEEEIAADFRFTYQPIQLAYAAFDPKQFEGQVSVDESKLQAYFQEHQQNYKESEKRQFSYVKGADFAALAGKHSKDESTAKNGGDLGFFGRERMVQPFSDAAFSMKPGEISDLVRTPFGFHIIKVEDVRPESTKTFEQVRTEIENAMKKEKARDVAFRKVTDFTDVVYAQQDLEKTSKSFEREVMKPDTWFAQTDQMPDMDGAGPEFMGKLFSLPDKSVSDVMEVADGFAVVQVRAIQPERTMPFESVKDRLEKDYRVAEGRNLAQKSAAELLESARKSGSLEEAAKTGKIDVKKTDWFSRRQPDKDLKLRGDSLSRVLRLQTGEPLPESPLTDVGNRFIVCQLTGRQDPDADLEKERPTIAKRLLTQKQSVVWRNWLEARRKQADIKILKEL